jgi:hypothetical protein
MQTIKGLIILLVVAAAVFVIVARNDIKSQAEYAARLLKPVNVADGVNAGVPKAGELDANAATNVLDQARRKSPRT